MKFKIDVLQPSTGERRIVVYDNETSELTDEVGNALVAAYQVAERSDAPRTSRSDPLGKRSPRVLKISLGLSCNYACEYCSQRFVPRASETNPGDIAGFLNDLDAWVRTPPERVEFWGGEPVVYIKTLRPLAEALRAKYPDASFGVITNGSLLTPEINAWLDRLGFSVGISHDGPGQHVRGPDPLADPVQREAILDLYRRLAPQRRISFNAMMNRHNLSRAAVVRFFVELTGDRDVPIGEGTVVDAYDEGGLANSLGPDDRYEFRGRAFREIRTGQAANFSVIKERVAAFVNSVRTRRPASSVGQKCGMDQPDAIAVDLRGNVLTCQNVSAEGVAPNGERHRIGHVSDLSAARLKTATHWSHRSECPKCPVLQICKGSCMFLEGRLWEASCNNAYSDALPIFAAGLEFLTGYVPLYIEGDLPQDRKDVFGLLREPPGASGGAPHSRAKPFPIPVVAA
jgi:uncharacterized protein